MTNLGKKIGIFVISLILIIAFANVLFRFILPIKPVKMISEGMEPTYHKYEILFYKEVEDYQINDVVLMSIPGGKMRMVTRIIEINKDGTFEMKCDAIPIQMKEEQKVSKEQINGKVQFSVNPFVFYSLAYGIEIILAVLITFFVYNKTKT